VKRTTGAGYLFILPNILGFAIFVFLPVVASLCLAFMAWDMFHWPPKFVGLQNFWNILGFHGTDSGLAANDPKFWKCLYNTCFLMLNIPLSMAGSLCLAMLLNRAFRGRTLFRTIVFLPTICSGVAIFILWRWVLHPDFGLLNSFLACVGIDGPEWLNSYNWAKPGIMLVMLWTSVGGYNMIIFLAGLQGIPQQLYEAASIDGAGIWTKFWNVTWPMLAPTTFFIFIMSVISGFQGGFEAAYLMTGGGPAGSTTTLSYYIYNYAYQFYEMGYASAIAWILFLLVFVATLFSWRFGSRKAEFVQ